MFLLILPYCVGYQIVMVLKKVKFCCLFPESASSTKPHQEVGGYKKEKHQKPKLQSFLWLDEHLIWWLLWNKSLCFLVFIRILLSLDIFSNTLLCNGDELMPHRHWYVLVNLLPRWFHTSAAIPDKYNENYTNIGKSEETFALYNAVKWKIRVKEKESQMKQN